MARIQWSSLEEPKRILAAIVQLSEGRTFQNKTNLFKAYYWAHIFYWRRHKGTLTKAPGVIRMPRGPGVDRHDDILKELAREGVLEIDVNRWGAGEENSRFTFKSLKSVPVSDQEADAIRSAIQLVEGHTTDRVSEASHNRSWELSSNGDEMRIYLDAMSEEEYRALSESVDRAERDLAGLF